MKTTQNSICAIKTEQGTSNRPICRTGNNAFQKDKVKLC